MKFRAIIIPSHCVWRISRPIYAGRMQIDDVLQQDCEKGSRLSVNGLL